MFFTVNGEKWQLSFVKPNDVMLMRSDKTITLGVTDDNYRTVFINNKLNGRLLDKVLCHELVHVFSFAHDLNIPIKTEELIADFLATYGRDVFDVADELLTRMMKVAIWKIK